MNLECHIQVLFLLTPVPVKVCLEVWDDYLTYIYPYAFNDIITVNPDIPGPDLPCPLVYRA